MQENSLVSGRRTNEVAVLQRRQENSEKRRSLDKSQAQEKGRYKKTKGTRVKSRLVFDVDSKADSNNQVFLNHFVVSHKKAEKRLYPSQQSSYATKNGSEETLVVLETKKTARR